MLTANEILNGTYFHLGECTKHTGPRGGIKVNVYCARRNGSTKYWKTRPNEFRIPVKYGMRDYGYITDRNVNEWHTQANCTLVEK